VFASIDAKAGERGGETIIYHSSSWTTRSHISQGISLFGLEKRENM